MAKSKTTIAEVKPKIVKIVKAVSPIIETSVANNVIVSTSVSNVLASNNVLVSNNVLEPVKGKRGRKSKKELMAALGVVVPENTNTNNMVLSVTELQEHVDLVSNLVSNIVIISNPNLLSLEDEADEAGEAEAEEAEAEETIHKQISKKRGRKPKGGKIIQQVIPVDGLINDKPNVILHLKCSMKELQNSINSNSIESYAFNAKNNLCYDVIGSENINSVNTYFSDKNNMSSNSLKTVNGANNCFNDYNYDDEEEEDGNTNKDATKEIWKKLKQLEHNLHINNVNNKKSACFWDSCDFDNPPIYIPKHFIHGTYHVY